MECIIEGCEKKKHGRGLCAMHYNRNKNNGTLENFPILLFQSGTWICSKHSENGIISGKCIECNKEKKTKFCDKHNEEMIPVGKNQVLKCKSCNKKYQVKWFANNKELQRKRSLFNSKQRMERNQRFVVGYLLEHPCIDCGEKDPVVLEFDHINNDKLDNICALATSGVPIERIINEIQKCEVVCSNCHRRRTAKRGHHLKWQITNELI